MTHASKRSNYIPSKGERLELRRLGLILRGTVLYADQVQVLVKWDSCLPAGPRGVEASYG
jgi:hypothetical protein